MKTPLIGLIRSNYRYLLAVFGSLFFLANAASGQTLEQGLDTTGITWSTSGDANWVGQTGVTHDGVDAAKNGDITNSQSSNLSATINGPAVVSFWWKVSSELGYDYLSVKVDGNFVTGADPISGFTDWAKVTIGISSSGPHTIVWSYEKDSSDSNYADTGYVDEVVVTAITQPPVIDSPLTDVATVNQPYSYFITGTNFPDGFDAVNLPAWATIDTFTGEITGTPPALGTFDITLQATNAIGTGEAVLHLTVDIPIPKVISAATIDVVQGQAINYYIEASNIPESFSTLNLPAGLTLDTGTGQITGNLTTIGSFPFTARATNSFGTGTKVVTINVASAVPVVSAIDTLDVVQGDSINIFIDATNNPTSYSAVNLPTGLTLNNSTGEITGSIATVGTFNFTVNAINDFGTGSKPATINVASGAPEVSPIVPVNVIQDEAIYIAIYATHTPTSYSALNLPAGLSLDVDTGEVTGHITPVGIYAFTLRATNAYGTGATNVKVNVASAAPFIFNPGVFKTTVNTPFQFFPSVGNVADSFTAENLPSGFTINPSTGEVNGTPTVPGMFVFTVKATNTYGTGSKAINLQVLPNVPVIFSSTYFGWIPNLAMSYQIQATNSPTSYSAKNLIPGLTINTATGLISGTPTAPAGNYQMLVQATNAVGTGSQIVYVNFDENAFSPQINSASGTVTGVVGTPFSYQITTSITANSFAAAPLPAGLTVNANGLISGTPTTVGTTVVTLSATQNTNVSKLNVTFDILPAGSAALAAALDVTGTVITNGDGKFFSQTKVTHDGVDAAESPPLGASQSSYLWKTFTGPGTVTFWWKHDGDDDGSAIVKTNGEYASTAPGGVPYEYGVFDWKKVTVILPDAAEYNVQWIAEQSSDPTGKRMERLWVDEVTFTPLANVAPIILSQPHSMGMQLGTDQNFQAYVFGKQPITIQWKKDTVAVGTASTDTEYPIVGAQETDAGTYSFVASNSVGDTSSQSFQLAVQDYTTALDAVPEFLWHADLANGTSLVTSADSHLNGSSVRITKTSSTSAEIDGWMFSGNIMADGKVKFWWKCVGNPGSYGFAASSPYASEDMINDAGSGWQQGEFSVSLGNSYYGSQFGWAISGDVGTQLLIDHIEFIPGNESAPVLSSYPASAYGCQIGSLVKLEVGTNDNNVLVQWKKNGADIADGTSNTLLIGSFSPADAGVYTCVIANAYGTTTTPPCVVSLVDYGTPVGDAGDWISESDNASGIWAPQYSVKVDGPSALRSGTITHRQYSKLSHHVRGPGVLTFATKISSEFDSDELRISINDSALNYFYEFASNITRSGEVDWRQNLLEIPAGDYDVTFYYAKDSDTSVGSDAAWVDQVSFSPGDPGIPVITKQPEGLVAEATSNVTLEVVATGPALTYQWKLNNVALAGKTSSTLNIPSLAAANVGSYTCVVGNPYGTVTTNPAALSLVTNLGTATELATTKWQTTSASPWTLVATPNHDGVDSLKSGTVAIGASSRVNGLITGPKRLNYFYKIDGAASSAYLRVKLDGVQASEFTGTINWTAASLDVPLGAHRVEFEWYRASASAVGDAAYIDQLTLAAATLAAPTTITTPPQSQVAALGSQVTLSIVTAGLPTSYQWKKNGVIIPGAIYPTYIIPAVATTDAAAYTVAMNNGLTSTAANLTVITPAASAGVLSGQTALLKQVATGSAVGITYTWKKGSTVLTTGAKYLTATTPAMSVKTVTAPGDVGRDYTCEVKLGAQTLVMGPYEIAIVAKPQIAAFTVPPAIVSGPFYLKLASSGLPTIWIIKSGTLPRGVTFNTATGVFSGTPDVSTPLSGLVLKIAAKNAFGESDPVTVTLNIASLPAGVVGSFVGLLDRNPDLNGNLGGSIAINVTATGAFTGTLKNGTDTHPLTGRLIASPQSSFITANLTIARPTPAPARPALQLNLSYNSYYNWLDGIAESNGKSASFLVTKAAAAAAAAPLAGTYNNLLSVTAADLADATKPHGWGWTQMTVTSAGIITFAGKTSDGTALTAASAVASTTGPVPVEFDGTVAIHQLLYTNKGSIHGYQVLHQSGSAPTYAGNWVDGNLSWLKTGPSAATDHTYAAGFTETFLYTDGAKYVKPVAANPIILGLANAKVVFADADVESAAQFASLAQTFTITTANVAQFKTATTGNPCKVGMTIVAATGLFNGTFSLVDSGVPRTGTYSGVLLSHRGKGYGHFLLKSLSSLDVKSGQVTLSAP